MLDIFEKDVPRKYIIRERSIDKFDSVLKDWIRTNKVLGKLKEIVEKEKSFEEESLQYNYKGKDKKAILDVMEFFYENLYKRVFHPFTYIDNSDCFENYNIYVKYKNKYTWICMLYGQGSTCIIKSVKENEIKTNKTIINLDTIHCSISGEVNFYE